MGLVSGYLTFKIMSFGRSVEVPDLGGRTLVEANDMLTRKGLYLRVEGEEFDPLVLAGHIIKQEIPPGNKVKEDRGIRVIVSKGPRFLSVPIIAGQGVEEAEVQLNRSGLRVNKIIYVHSDSAEKGRVIAQRPNSDEPIREGGISMVVSSGSYDIIYYCPDLSGKTKEETIALTDKLGLRAEFSGIGGTVKSQKPKANTAIKKGDTIFFQLGGGTKPHD